MAKAGAARRKARQVPAAPPASAVTGTVAQGQSIRHDGWANVVTGWGLANRDKSKSGTFGYADVLDRVTLEELYRGDGIAAKIVDKLPNEMTREWINLTVGDDKATADAMLKWLEDLKAPSAFNQGQKWARLYGGSGVVMGIDDGQLPDMPLNERRIKSIRFLNVLDRWQLYVAERYTDPTQPKFGEPKLYTIQQIYGGPAASGQRIHESRILRFDGVELPPRQKYQNLGWGDSVLVRLFNAIRNYARAHDAAPQILEDFTQAVYKLAGLAKKLAANDDKAVAARLQAIELGRSILNAIVLGEDDSFERQTTSVTGIDLLIMATERRLTAESEMPHSLILGESPGASLGEAGNSQKRDWYDLVASCQKTNLQPGLQRLIELGFLCKTGPTRGKVPKDWAMEFRSLWQQDEGDAADVRLKQAQADDLYIGNGTLTAEEVAESRFGSGKWSPDTIIDLEARNREPEPEPEPDVVDEEAAGKGADPADDE